MKQKLSIILFLCGLSIASFGQTYIPTIPTTYGQNMNRVKAWLAQHVPEKDSLLTLTSDTTAQLFVNKANGMFVGYYKPKGFRYFTMSSSPTDPWVLSGNYIDTSTDRLGSMNTPLELTAEGNRIANFSYNDGNTLIGRGIMHPTGGATENIALGSNALGVGLSSFNNIAVGQNALSSLTDGSNNIGIGKSAGAANVSGSDNTYVGSFSGKYMHDSTGYTIFNNYDQANVAGDINNSPIVIKQDVNPLLTDIRFNGKIQATLLPQSSSTGDSVMVKETGTGLVKTRAQSAIGANIYTYSGMLTGDRILTGARHSLNFTGLSALYGDATDELNFTVGSDTNSAIIASNPSQVVLNTLRGIGGAVNSSVIVSSDLIEVDPYRGRIKIDSFALASSSTNKYLTVWDTATKMLENINPTSIISGNTLQQVITNGATLIGNNTITNGANTLTITNNTVTGNAFEVKTNSTTASATQTMIYANLLGANANSGQSTYGIQSINAHSGTGSTNYGVYGAASTATTNIGGYFSASGGTAYSVRLTDGTEGVGKVLTSDAAGNANWIIPTIPTLQQVIDNSNTATNTGIIVKGSASPIIATGVGISSAADKVLTLNTSTGASLFDFSAVTSSKNFAFPNTSGTIALVGGSGVGTVTSIATGYGLSGGTITTSGTVIADSSVLLPVTGHTYATTSGVGTLLQGGGLTAGSLLTLNSTGVNVSSNTGAVLKVNTLGANVSSNRTTNSAIFTNTHTGTGSVNIAGKFISSGGATNAALQLVDGSEGVGKVLTSDAAGIGSWQTLSGSTPSWDATLIVNPTTSQYPTAPGYIVDQALDGVITFTPDGGTNYTSVRSRTPVGNFTQTLQARNGTIIDSDQVVTLISSSTPGIDNVLAAGNTFSTNRTMDARGFDFVIGSPTSFSTNGNIETYSDANNTFSFTNDAGNVKVGINTSTPSVPFESVGDAFIHTAAYPDGLFMLNNAGFWSIGDYGDKINGTSISGDDGGATINMTANNGYTLGGGSVTISNLSGTGTRGVTASSSGVLGTTVGTLTSVVASADSTALSATDANVTTYTPASDGSYQVLVYSDITAISAATLTITCTYTDTHSNTRATTFYGMGTTTAGIGALGSSNFPPVGLLRVKGGTAITVVATFTGVSITYDVSAKIISLQ